MVYNRSIKTKHKFKDFIRKIKHMENSNNTKVERVIFPPNKPMYRKLTFSTSPKLYDSLLFMDFNKEGTYFNSFLKQYRLKSLKIII